MTFVFICLISLSSSSSEVLQWSTSTSKRRSCVLVLLLAGQEAAGLRLEGDDDHGQFEVPLLLQLSQDSGPEEHLTLTDAVQVGVQVQVLHLWGGEETKSSIFKSTCCSSIKLLLPVFIELRSMVLV